MKQATAEPSDDGSDQRATCQTLEVISCPIEDFYGILAAWPTSQGVKGRVAEGEGGANGGGARDHPPPSHIPSHFPLCPACLCSPPPPPAPPRPVYCEAKQSRHWQPKPCVPVCACVCAWQQLFFFFFFGPIIHLCRLVPLAFEAMSEPSQPDPLCGAYTPPFDFVVLCTVAPKTFRSILIATSSFTLPKSGAALGWAGFRKALRRLVGDCGGGSVSKKKKKKVLEEGTVNEPALNTAALLEDLPGERTRLLVINS